MKEKIMNRMQKINESGFTPRVLPVTNSKAPWYEYCPSSEAEFKDVMSAIVNKQQSENKSMRIMAMNIMIKRYDMSTASLSESPTDEDLVNAYWAFYQKNFIAIGYTKSEKVSLQVFSVSELDRRLGNHVH